MFNLHKNNLLHIRAIVAAYGVCFFHGDGNTYYEESASNITKDYSNPLRGGAPGPGSYRVEFRDIKDIPKDIPGLEKMLIEAKANEGKKEAAKARKATGYEPKVFDFEGSDTFGKKAPETIHDADQLAKAAEAISNRQEQLADRHLELNSREADLANKAKALADKEAELNAKLAALSAAPTPQLTPKPPKGSKADEKESGTF